MARVGATLEALDDASAEFGAAMIDRLSVTAPSSLRLLPPDGERAGPAVLHELRTFCDLVGDFPALRGWAHELGAATGTRVSASELHAIGAAMIDSMCAVLGGDFGPEDLAAWRSAVCLVIELMR
jgi:hypothetical protein